LLRDGQMNTTECKFNVKSSAPNKESHTLHVKLQLSFTQSSGNDVSLAEAEFETRVHRLQTKLSASASE
jgi:hypothetical protein